MITYQNYHRHSEYTNVIVADSTVTNKQYAIRAKELGHGIVSSCEHGYQGKYIECYNLAKKYGLKFVFCAEAYWVKDRTINDDTNGHIILAALNEAGRRSINRILSEANRSGFYYRARVDIDLLLSLNPQDVVITTACVAFWKYEDIEDIVVRLHTHFKDHFFLEVQCHNTIPQQELNTRIKNLHYKYHIPLIFGADSHFISEDQEQERTDFQYSKEIHYEDEAGWYLDYVDGDTVYNRFVQQGVLSHDEIIESLENTNIFLQVEEYDSPIFDSAVKMPTLYPDLTQSQIDEKYQQLIWEQWKSYSLEVPESMWDTYKQEIQKEIDIVIESHTADYFIINYYIIKRGKELGGVITSTGRGSAVSFITNKLLGFTEVDRIQAQVKMYPERFMSATRILETGSLPDIDFNLGTIEPFARAQQEILGEKHAYPMIAYGTMKKSGAWKMFAKANNIPFEISNIISGQINKYEKALKYADDDNAVEQIQIKDFIDAEYLDIYKGSEKYLSTIVSWSIAPSAYLLYQGNIEEEIGLIKIKDHLCCLMDGHWAEENHFLKNDLLKVVVVDLIDQVFREIGQPRLSVSELLDLCPSADKVWDIYAKSCTIGVNQVEQPGTSARAAKYAPTNIAELCSFVAAIRPGFKSMYKTFESRDRFSYGIASFDALIQTPFMKNSFVLFQEQVMRTLNYAGIPMAECYGAIKNISKKRIEKVLQLKFDFIQGFSDTLKYNEGLSDQEAATASDTVWQIVEDNSNYSFNASHAYCVALDSLYCAYLKSHYPVQFYGVYIRLHTEAGNKKKVNAAQAEAESYFRIRFPPFRFGQDNSIISIDVPNKSIYMALNSIKGFNKSVGRLLAEKKENHYQYFSDLLMELRPFSVTATTTTLLTKIDYFEQFGNTRELLQIIDVCEMFKYGEMRTIRESKFENTAWADIVRRHATNVGKKGNLLKTFTILDCPEIIRNIEDRIKNAGYSEVDMRIRIQNQLEILGYVSTITHQEKDRRLLVVLDVYALIGHTTHLPWGYVIETQSLGSGKHGRMTIRAEDYVRNPVEKNNIVYADHVYKNAKGYWYLDEYTLRG